MITIPIYFLGYRIEAKVKSTVVPLEKYYEYIRKEHELNLRSRDKMRRKLENKEFLEKAPAEIIEDIRRKEKELSEIVTRGYNCFFDIL